MSTSDLCNILLRNVFDDVHIGLVYNILRRRLLAIKSTIVRSIEFEAIGKATQLGKATQPNSPRHNESRPPTAATTTMNTIDARLQPWLSTLEKLALPAHIEEMLLSPDDGVPCTLWIGCTELFSQRTTTTASELELLDRVCETLSILTLLAHVDFDLWTREIMKLWPVNEKLRSWIEYKLAPVARNEPLFAVGLDVSKLQYVNARQLMRIHYHNVHNTRPSAEYVALCTELLETVAAAEDAVTANKVLFSSVRVRIELDCVQLRRGDAVQMLQEATYLVESERNSSSPKIAGSFSSPPVRSPRFVIQELSLATPNSVELGEVELAILKKLAAHGLRIGHIPPLRMIELPLSEEKDPTKDLVENVRFLTGLEEPDLPGVRLVSISDRCLPLVGTALLSALQQSPCVRTVELNLNGEFDLENDENEEDEDPHDRCEAWQWAAYSLFSRYTAHKIERLEMDLHNLQRIEVDAVRQVLGSSNPLALLLDPYREATEDSNMYPIEVQASRFCVMDPAERSHDDSSQHDADYTVTTRRPITVRVFEPPTNDEDPWWSVFLPGKGMAWLHRDDVLSTIQSDPNGDDHGHGEAAIVLPSFRRIDIARLSDDSRDAVADLMELIGAGTRRVDLHNHIGRQPIDDWCTRVLRACPQLEELQLRRTGVESLQFLVDAAEAGHCKLQALMVLCVLTTESQHVRRFFETLRDPRHALARHLQDLELWLMIEKHDVSDIIGPALQMLEQNRQLHTIRLGFHVAPEVASLDAVFQQAFAAQLETHVPIRLAPLEIQSKLALLSVVFAESTMVASSAVHRLDSSLLSIVFQFAAHARTRVFTLSFSSVSPVEQVL